MSIALQGFHAIKTRDFTRSFRACFSRYQQDKAREILNHGHKKKQVGCTLLIGAQWNI